MPLGRSKAMMSWGAATAFVVGAMLALAPTSGHAVEGGPNAPSFSGGFTHFTPVGVDPELAERANAFLAARGLRFTPTESVSAKPRELTVAVRVDNDVARAVSIRRAIPSAGERQIASAPVLLSSSRYDLGTARGYQSFAKAPSLAKTVVPKTPGVRNIPMADLSEYRPTEERKGKPSRWGARIALETDQDSADRTPRTFNSLGEQSVDVGGSYRVLKNFDVQAGVRLSQDRDRIEPLTDSAQDAQSVYVGTKLRF